MADQKIKERIFLYGLKPAAERAILAALPPDAGDEGLPLIVADIGAPEGKRILDSPQEYGENPVVFLCQETRLPDPGSLGAFPCAVALGRRCTPKALRLAVSTALRLYGTRRELAEYAGRLSDLERRARLLIDGYPDPVLISTMDGRILVANGEACSLFGMPEKRLEERFLWELAPNRQGEGWPDADELKLRIASIRRGEPVRFTWDRTADDGTVREVTLRQSVTPGGKFIQAVIRDDSLKYRIERKLLDCEGRLEALLRSFPFEFWTCDADGAITYQNAVSRERFGNHIGARFRDIGSEEILHLGRQENTAMALLGETIIVNHEYIAHGSYRSVHEVICPVNIEGMITGTMGFSIDTTDRSIAKKKLEHQERFQEDLIDSSPFGIMIYNARTRVISRINETLTRITGYTIEDIPDGPSWWRKAFPDPEYRERKMREHRDRYMPAIAEGLHLEPHEGRIQRKDGSYIWIEA